MQLLWFGSSACSTCNCISFHWQRGSQRHSHLICPLAVASLLLIILTGGSKIINGWGSGEAEQSSWQAKVRKTLWFKWFVRLESDLKIFLSLSFFPRENNLGRSQMTSRFFFLNNEYHMLMQLPTWKTLAAKEWDMLYSSSILQRWVWHTSGSEAWGKWL